MIHSWLYALLGLPSAEDIARMVEEALVKDDEFWNKINGKEG